MFKFIVFYSDEWKSPDAAHKYTFKVECSAQNGFGGMNRKTYFIDVQKDGIVYLQFDDSIQEIMSVGFSVGSAVEINIERLKKSLN